MPRILLLALHCSGELQKFVSKSPIILALGRFFTSPLQHKVLHFQLRGVFLQNVTGRSAYFQSLQLSCPRSCTAGSAKSTVCAIPLWDVTRQATHYYPQINHFRKKDYNCRSMGLPVAWSPWKSGADWETEKQLTGKAN